MQKYFDIIIKPLSNELDQSLGIRHIPVTYIPEEKDPFGNELQVPVRVHYYNRNTGTKKWLNNFYIESMKMLGVLPR